MKQSPSFEPIAPRVDEAGIGAFEHRHGLKLPEDYRKFLKSHNGGYPRPSVFVAENGKMLDLRVLYGLGANEPAMDIEVSMQRFASIFGRRMLPVGDDMTEQLVLMDPTKGEIYTWGGSVPHPDLPASLTFISRSFSRLLSRAVFPARDSILELAERGTANDLEKFIASGGSPTACTNKFHFSLLEASARAGNVPIVIALLAKNVPLGDAAHLAISAGQPDVLRAILVRRALTGAEQDRNGMRLVDGPEQWDRPNMLAVLEASGLHPRKND